MNQKFNFKKATAGIFSLALVGSMASMFPVTAFAGDQTVNTVEDMVAWMQCFEGDNTPYIFTGVSEYTVDSPANLAVAPEQTSFDLRNVNGKNYVSPVKQQNPYGTCWAFAATAAAESSIAHEIDFDFNTESDPIDLSEHHLAYFSATPLPESSMLYSSQAGEGQFVPRVEEMKEAGYDLATLNNMFYFGGITAYATTLYSSFCGPTAENVVPYRGSSGRIEASCIAFDFIKDPTEPVTLQNFRDFTGDLEILCYTPEEYEQALSECKGELVFNADVDSWYHGPGIYLFIDGGFQLSKADDWSVSEDLRFTGIAELERSCILPCPSTKDSNGAYRFNENGVNAIKNELVNGRAVSIGLLADQSQPGQTYNIGGFMNYLDENGNVVNPEEAKYWCHYTYDTTYDPSDPESINKFVNGNHAVTIVGYDDSIPKEYFYDPKGTIGGDGAFIVKNSWGSLDTDGNFWGSEGSGYFYLSYYDQSLDSPESFDFKLLTDESLKKDKYSAAVPFMYDLMPSAMLYEPVCKTEASMANVFETIGDTQIRSVGYTAISANEEITYDVYILNEDAVSPTDGVLAGHASEVYQYSGYQRTELDKPVTVKAGQRFSVVVTAKREDGNYGIGLKIDTNENYYQQQLNHYREAGMSEERISDVDVLGSKKYGKGVVNQGESMVCINGEWTDFADILSEVYADGTNILDYDNFSIKAYGDGEIIGVANQLKTTPKESYQAGDVVDCQILAVNQSALDFENVEFYVNDKKVSTIELLKSTKDIAIDYQYTVTEEDIQNGEFQTTVKVLLTVNGEQYEANLIDGFSETTLTVPVNAEQPTEEATEESAPEVIETQETTEEATEPEEVDTQESTEEATEPEVIETQEATEDSSEPEEIDTQEESTENANKYSDEKLCKMAVKDYNSKYGISPDAELSLNADGSVEIVLSDKDGNVLDTYTIDPNTAKGKNSKGEDVNLPQTGNNAPATAAAAAAATGLTVAGAFVMLRSLLGRKKD